MPPDAVYREVCVERLVLREPGSGRTRAILDTTAATDDGYPGVQLALLDAAGDQQALVELDGGGEPRVTLGHGRFSVVLSDRGLAIWADGNEVAVLDSGDGGRLELSDGDGKSVLRLP